MAAAGSNVGELRLSLRTAVARRWETETVKGGMMVAWWACGKVKIEGSGDNG